MKNNDDKILQWALSQVNLIIDKFSEKGNKAVFFNEFDAMGINVPFQIPEPNDQDKGGELILNRNDDKIKVIEYHMYKGAVLDIHHHPDAMETFDIKKGKMLNEVTGIEYGPGDECIMYAFEAHQFRCTEDAFMIITLEKV